MDSKNYTLSANAIPGYKIISVLGKGAMGIVYKALQESMQRVVAIKVLPDKLASDSSFIRRFVQEARIVAKLRHENIISAYDAGEHNGIYFFIMEYVEGDNLATILQKRTTFSAEEAAKIVSQIAGALHYAHFAGLIHRDVKPGNIIITQNGTAKLCDLGLTLSVEQLHEKKRNSRRNTILYIA
ncbi:MAG: serine/threonine-protein kinase [Planctomycetota bacterium]